MITFDQTLDAVERILEHMKSVAELDSMIEHVKEVKAREPECLEPEGLR